MKSSFVQEFFLGVIHYFVGFTFFFVRFGTEKRYLVYYGQLICGGRKTKLEQKKRKKNECTSHTLPQSNTKKKFVMTLSLSCLVI